MILPQDSPKWNEGIKYHSMKRRLKSINIKDDLFEEEITCFNKTLTDYTKCKDEDNSNQTVTFTDNNKSRINTESNLRSFFELKSHIEFKEFNEDDLLCNNATQFSLIQTKKNHKINRRSSIFFYIIVSLIINVIIGMLLFERYIHQLKFETLSSIRQDIFQFKYIYHNYSELLNDNY